VVGVEGFRRICAAAKSNSDISIFLDSEAAFPLSEAVLIVTPSFTPVWQGSLPEETAITPEISSIQPHAESLRSFLEQYPQADCTFLL
jgi:hypothetical protein